MNTKEPEYSVEEENTERLIGRANRLGYTITSIEIEPGRVAISIVPSPLFPYTPELDRDFETDQGLRVKMCVWLGVSRGLDLAFLNAD
ncbi:hypothetical protein CYJ20_007405 [Winkia neuii]|uniref:hypothetical protein n=1 Tax=Actinomycetes TaxID=1760 RepID=UPI00061D8713|nr:MULTISPECIES: hypothetical protein [Actinomycetes]MDU6112372.1 hypothetical protein [Winkia neuii]WIK90058.1 hypothetical protein CYJ20_007405 [Winkia neuii]BDY02513.1 hypothetical protein TPCV302_19050 [Cutibacterium avidum]CRH92026.1 Uncharacterised protein [Chlamydia trachomatis]